MTFADKKVVTIAGAAGRVGLPFAVVCAQNPNYLVFGLDTDWDAVEKLDRGYLGFRVENGEKGQSFKSIFDEVRKQQRLHFRDAHVKDISYYEQADIIVVMIGTPLDGESNPDLKPIFDLFDTYIIPALKNNKKNPRCPLIVLRSTVAPGITRTIGQRICRADLFPEIDFNLVFAPERASQGHSLIETKTVPQPIGAFSDEGFVQASTFFLNIMGPNATVFQCEPEAAELTKIMTNMYRYINFALANEFMMICDHHDIDYNQVRNMITYDYPRAAGLAGAGPNVGGPCLFKDGKLLTQNLQYPDMIQSALSINEGMPAYIMDKIKAKYNNGKGARVCILGATFKAEQDDIRHSLTFKLGKLLKAADIDYTIYDPNWIEQGAEDHLTQADHLQRYNIYVVMTPHKVFNDEKIWLKFHDTDRHDDKYIIDLWNHLDVTKEAQSEPNSTIVNGCYTMVRWDSGRGGIKCMYW